METIPYYLQILIEIETAFILHETLLLILKNVLGETIRKE